MFDADKPIVSEKEDLLGRDVFAKQLARAILSYNQSASFNIGLYGEWGSGKTSVINMIEENIRILTDSQANRPVIVRFNPWLFSDQTQLTIQFFKQLSTAFKKISVIKGIGQTIDALGAAFEFTSFIPVIGGMSGSIAKIVQGIGKGLANNAISPDIQQIKNEIVAKLEKEKVKTIVIVDDVDRLSNQEIRTVFQLIKSIADFPNTIYLLAFDYDIVTKALKEVQNIDGAKYLEKIIQVPFHLPEINEQQLINLFLERLNIVVGEIPEEKFDSKRWSQLFHSGIKPYLKKVRDVVRLNNTIALKYAFLKNEVDIIDLIGITTIQVFIPNLFTVLSAYKDSFCGDFAPYFLSSDDKERSSCQSLYETIISSLEEDDRKYVLEILMLLFPKVSSTMKKGFTGTYYYHNGHTSVRLGNIYNIDYFDRYFSLSFNKSLSLVQAEYVIFKAEEEDLIRSLFEMDRKNQINLFLNYLDATMIPLKKSDKYQHRISILLRVILSHWDTLHDPDSAKFFSYPWAWRLINAFSNLLWVFAEESRRFSCINDIFELTDVSLSIKVQVLLHFEYEHNRYKKEDDKEEKVEEQTLDLDHVINLEDICFETIRSLIVNNDLINENGFSWIKWFVEDSKNEHIRQLFTDYMIAIVRSDVDLAKLISSLISHGKGASDFVFEIWRVDFKLLGQYFNIEDAITRMSNFMKSDSFHDLELSIREDILALLVFYEIKDQAYREDITRPRIKQFADKNGIKLN